MTRAEEVKAIEKKVRKGGQLTSEDLKIVKAVDGQLLFGYHEKTRLAKLVADPIDETCQSNACRRD